MSALQYVKRATFGMACLGALAAQASLLAAEPAKPAPKKRASRAKKAVAAEAAPEAVTTGEAEPVAADGDAGGSGPDGEPRRGWWQRTFGN